MTNCKKVLAKQVSNQIALFGGEFIDLSGLEDEIKEQMSAIARKSALSRNQIAAQISDMLGDGREISKNMLDALLSTGKSDYHLHIDSVTAFCHIMNNYQPLRTAAEAIHRYLISAKDQVYVEMAQIDRKMEDLSRKKKELEARAR